VFNTHIVIDPNGDIAAAYRKIHLFDVDIPNGPVLMGRSQKCVCGGVYCIYMYAGLVS
jgi:deaminated glutathione amidase